MKKIGAIFTKSSLRDYRTSRSCERRVWAKGSCFQGPSLLASPALLVRTSHGGRHGAQTSFVSAQTSVNVRERLSHVGGSHTVIELSITSLDSIVFCDAYKHISLLSLPVVWIRLSVPRLGCHSDRAPLRRHLPAQGTFYNIRLNLLICFIYEQKIMYIHIYIYIYTYTHTYMSVYMRTYTYIYIYIYIYIYNISVYDHATRGHSGVWLCWKEERHCFEVRAERSSRIPSASLKFCRWSSSLCFCFDFRALPQDASGILQRI